MGSFRPSSTVRWRSGDPRMKSRFLFANKYAWPDAAAMAQPMVFETVAPSKMLDTLAAVVPWCSAFVR